MFHGILGQIVDAADGTTEADPVGVYASLLAGAGVLMGPRPHVMVGNTRHPLLIWPLLFGRTGSGRKGEATGTAEIFLLSSSIGPWAPLFVSGLSSGEGLIERIRDVRDEEDKGGSEDKRLVVIEPEFATVLARAKREGSTLGSVLRLAWDGKPLSVLNRTALKASSSHVGIIGHVTPKEFRMKLAEAEISGGTYNRFLPFFVERSKRLPIPEGVDEQTRRQLGAELTEKIVAAGQARSRITLDRGAVELWHAELYDEMTEADDEDEAWSEFARRAAPYCLRAAALLTVLDEMSVIHDVHLKAAGALVKYSIASAKYVLDRQIRDPRLDRIRRNIDAAGQDGLTRSAISGLFSRNLAKTVLDELLDGLVDTGEYERFDRATGGRPAEAYRKVAEAA
jgi:hypothetical protein